MPINRNGRNPRMNTSFKIIYALHLSLIHSYDPSNEKIDGKSFVLHPLADPRQAIALDNDGKKLTLRPDSGRTDPIKVSEASKDGYYNLEMHNKKLCVDDNKLKVCKNKKEGKFKLEPVTDYDYKSKGPNGRNEKMFKVVKAWNKFLFIKFKWPTCLTRSGGKLTFKTCSKNNADQLFSFENVPEKKNKHTPYPDGDGGYPDESSSEMSKRRGGRRRPKAEDSASVSSSSSNEKDEPRKRRAPGLPYPFNCLPAHSNNCQPNAFHPGTHPCVPHSFGHRGMAGCAQQLNSSFSPFMFNQNEANMVKDHARTVGLIDQWLSQRNANTLGPCNPGGPSQAQCVSR